MGSLGLKLTAIVLLALAVALAWYGYRLSTGPAAPEDPDFTLDMPVYHPDLEAVPAPERQRVDVVVADDDLIPGQRLGPGDLRTVEREEAPEGAFNDPEALIGHTIAFGVSEDEPLLPGHFGPRGPLGQVIGPGERAVAIAVDGVAGTGGYLMPGDRVDVLLYREDGRGGQPPIAKRVLADLRVVAYGPRIQREPGVEVDDPDFDTGQRVGTAVLAVSEAAAPRLVLANESGRLRLALRGALESNDSDANPTPTVPDERASHTTRLSDLLPSPPSPPATPAEPQPEPSGPAIEIYRGSQREEVEP